MLSAANQEATDLTVGRAHVANADEQVLYLSEQREEKFAEVRAKRSGPKTETLLDFRLTDVSGHWYAYDVIIDGAGLVSNYHAQFASIIRDHSYAGLVNKMKEKTLVVKAFETTTAPSFRPQRR